MKKVIETIPHAKHRYETVGDYWIDDEGVIQFRQSDMHNEDFEFLVSIHEQIEEHMTRRRGLKEPDIKAFDEMYEKERSEGLHSQSDEPGFDKRAPYLKEHTIATGVEMMLAGHMGVDWNEYANAVENCGSPKMVVEGVEQPGL
jgi:hypothetical protein